jgi:hypothetical protein
VYVVRDYGFHSIQILNGLAIHRITRHSKCHEGLWLYWRKAT